MTGAMFMAHCLKQEGVTKVFGQCGHTNYALIDACHKLGIDYVSFRHEQQAAHAALSQLGRCVTSHGHWRHALLAALFRFDKVRDGYWATLFLVIFLITTFSESFILERNGIAWALACAAAGIPFERPADSVIDQFARILSERGALVSVRKSRGRDIRAACGQLIVEGQKKSPAQRLAVAAFGRGVTATRGADDGPVPSAFAATTST